MEILQIPAINIVQNWTNHQIAAKTIELRKIGLRKGYETP